jgi:putative SOS response-associated peptidase YedK
MCNDYRLNVDLDTIAGDFSDLRIRIDFPEGRPNIEARDDVRITDVAPIVRAGTAPGTAELVQRRWSWPGPTGRPVYNFRSEGRSFGENRCLIIADGFYEFTNPAAIEGAPKKKRKDKWLFTMGGQRWFCIAGIYRQHSEVGEAFTMLTTEPGPDVAPFHDRQIVVLSPADAMRWLDPQVPAAAMLHALPAGSLEVRQVG